MNILNILNEVKTEHMNYCFFSTQAQNPKAKEFCDFKNDIEIFTKLFIAAVSGKDELINSLCPVAVNYESIFAIILSNFRIH